MNIRLLVACVAVPLGLASVPLHAQTVSPTASVVHLRTTCDVSDCFTTTSALTTWLWGGGVNDRTNEPSSTDRVVVRVGPGDFGPLTCDGSTGDRGYVSFVGSGRQQSRFVRVGTEPDAQLLVGACVGAIHVENCQELDFSHLGARGETGVFWVGGGDSTWSDVDMIGEQASCNSSYTMGWYDLSGAGNPGVHYFFGSRAIARDDDGGVFGFNATAAESWFYGGDVVAETQGGSAGVAAVVVSGADARFFGSTIRAQMESGSGADTNLFTGVWALDGAAFHLHGGIVNASADPGGADVDSYGIYAFGTGTSAHTPGSAFVVQPGGAGTATRVESASGATVQSPFVWPAGPVPPGAESDHGSDAFVETDAGTSGDEAHLMIRDASCQAGGGPWRDMATGSCRP